MRETIKELIPQKMSVIVARSPRQFGVFDTLKLLSCYIFGIKKVRVRSEKLDKEIIIRPGTEDQYIIDKFTKKKKWKLGNQKIKNIIDAGAHIGIASIVFSRMYPDAKIIAIEPEKENYELLKENTKSLRNVKAEKSALWYKSGELKIEKKGESWAHSVSEHGGSEEKVESKTVKKIARENGLEKIDVLKMDIEGAEREVLNNSESWAEIVECLIVEAHEWMKGGSTNAIKNFSRRNGMNIEKAGEDYIVYRNESIENVNI